MRKFGLTFAVVAALGVGALSAGTAAAPVLAATNTVSSGGGTAGASTSSLTAKKKAARRKALRKCNRKHSPRGRKACRKKVSKRFAIEPRPPVEQVEPSAFIDVRDDYFSPAVVNIKSGEAVGWVWYKINHDPHNVTLIDGPAGIDLMDFQTSSSPAEGYTWSRTFVKKGTYSFSCSLHKNMDMTVSVS